MYLQHSQRRFCTRFWVSFMFELQHGPLSIPAKELTCIEKAQNIAQAIQVTTPDFFL